MDAFTAKSLEHDQMMSEIQAYQRKRDPAVEGLIDEYQKGPEVKKEHKDKWMKKGSSPTKRLMEMKTAAHSHQPAAKKVQKSKDKCKNEYTLRYVSSPKKSYVVNPKEGEINYNLAYKNFDKFFNKVSTQKITKFRVSEDKKKKNPEKEARKWHKKKPAIKEKECTRPMMRLSKEKVEDMGKFLLAKHS